MRLLIDDTEIGLSPGQEITIQENSPITNLKQQGDKAFAFAVPQSPLLKAKFPSRMHKQGRASTESIRAKIATGPYVLLEGDLQLKRQNKLAAEMSMTVPPGGIPSKFWNKKLTEIDFTSYELPTEKIFDPIYALKNTDLGLSSATGTEVAFGSYYLANATIFRIKLGNQQVFEHVFMLSGLGFDTRRATAIADLTAALTEYNESPVIASSEIYATETEVTCIFPNTNSELFIEIYYNTVLIGAGGLPFTIKWNLKKISHDSAVGHLQVQGSRNTAAEGAVDYLFFPSIFAPKYYAEKADSYNGTVNSRDGGNLNTNNYAARTNYPLTPAFRWLYLIDLLLQKHNYTRIGNWDSWANLSLMAMRDFARQHPETTFPFNVYPTKMVVQDYLPDWTVAEFFDQFMIWTGSLLIWDIGKRELSIKTFPAILSEPPFLLPDMEFVDEEFTDMKQYAIDYTTTIEDELLSDEIKAFFGITEHDDDITVISVKGLPFAKLPADFNRRDTAYNPIPKDRANGTWVGTTPTPVAGNAEKLFSMDKCRSILYELTEATPLPRVLYLDGQTAANDDVYSLSRTSEVSMIDKLTMPLVNAQTGRILKVKGYMAVLYLVALNFGSTIYYMGSRYLLSKKQPTLKLNRKRHEVILELEKLE